MSPTCWGPRGASRRADPNTAHKSTLIRSAPVRSRVCKLHLLTKSIVWIKDHVRCDEFEIYLDRGSNCDEELLDLFLTGAPCTSAISINYADLSKVIVDLVQKFMALKNRDEYQVVESIRGYVGGRRIADEFKRNFAEFIGEEEQYEEDHGTRQIIGFINNDIEKKLTLDVRNDSYGPFSIKITNT
ncbi:hypothetical protein DdX_22420 [Ditylenchus destructor]|uniref:Uncharacterized protein n=1 Tax=Ditylenchus destructor TaxID=166010 RepID=A0AAD4QUH1_9BILA|nr:hypothetical protein DdX_22420 [Ditylenchus destructor]